VLGTSRACRNGAAVWEYFERAIIREARWTTSQDSTKPDYRFIDKPPPRVVAVLISENRRLRRARVLKNQFAELEEAVCSDTQQKGGDDGCDICGRPNAMDELTHDTDSRLTPPSLKLRAFAITHVLVAALAAMVLL